MAKRVSFMLNADFDTLSWLLLHVYILHHSLMTNNVWNINLADLGLHL